MDFMCRICPILVRVSIVCTHYLNNSNDFEITKLFISSEELFISQFKFELTIPTPRT